MVSEKDYAIAQLPSISMQMAQSKEIAYWKYYDTMKDFLQHYKRLLHVYHMPLDEAGKEFQERFGQDMSELRLIRQKSAQLPDGSEMKYLLQFYITSDILMHTFVLVKYYIPSGRLYYDILKTCYCDVRIQNDTAAQLELGLGRSSFYAEKRKAIGYAGYFLVKIIAPQFFRENEEKQMLFA